MLSNTQNKGSIQENQVSTQNQGWKIIFFKENGLNFKWGNPVKMVLPPSWKGVYFKRKELVPRRGLLEKDVDDDDHLEFYVLSLLKALKLYQDDEGLIKALSDSNETLYNH